MGKLKSRLQQSYGVKPSIHYFPGDMGGIRTYFEYREDNRLDEFLIDGITWDDLSGDDLFKRINQGLSTPGEQYLYYLLRSPAIDREEYDKRLNLIEMMENNPDIRLNLQAVLAWLGRSRTVNYCEVFTPSSHGLFKAFLYAFFILTFLISAIVCFLVSQEFLLLHLCVVIFLPIYHSYAITKVETEISTVNYSIAMIRSVKLIKKAASPELDIYLASFYNAGDELKWISQFSIVRSLINSGWLAQLLNDVLLLDLILFEFLKNRLGKHHRSIFHIYEYLGRIDSAISVASYRKSLGMFSTPQIDFSPSGNIRILGKGLVHPLVKDAVPNDIDSSESILVTGSNASGKSTFLKTVALNAIMAQSICTTLCERYSASAFRIYSSMAIADDIFAGDSYFIAEIKSLKRILDAHATMQPILCVIDEVLRGTNTVERIAASSEVLRFLATNNVICLAATHDIELCALLDGHYRSQHFEETIAVDGEIIFDYKVKDGPATTRNALKLLASMGFDSEIVNRANEKANRYMDDGKWLNV